MKQDKPNFPDKKSNPQKEAPRNPSQGPGRDQEKKHGGGCSSC